jgi:hypothetical protein
MFHVTADSIAIEKNNIFEEKPDEYDNRELDELIINEKEVDEDIKEVNSFEKEDDESINNDQEIRDNIKIDQTSVINESSLEEDYITYHIHIVKASETIETISSDYKIDKDKLLELNDISSISIGDKLIIPELNEEQ